MRSRFLSSAAALVVAAACDSFGADTSSGVPPDAGDASPAGERDGGVDAAQGSSFCARAGAHAFCEDFDEGDLVAGGWAPGDRRNVDGGTLAITPAIFESAPNALALDMTSVAAAGFANANDWLQRAFVAPTASKAVFSVGLRIDRIEPTSGDGGPYLSGRAVEIAIGSYYLEVDFAPRTGGYALTVYETSTDGSVPFVGHELGLMGSNGPALITEKAWHRVALTLDLGGDRLAVTVDELTGVESSPTPWHLPASAPSGVTLRLGGKTDASSTRLVFAYDDVTADLEPK